MEFLGSELGTLARVVVALLVVLGLIALTFWLIRRFGPITFNKTGVARGRQPRLALLESTNLARVRLEFLSWVSVSVNLEEQGNVAAVRFLHRMPSRHQHRNDC